MTDAPEHDSRPIPDPTVLTTEQLRRELNGLRELLEARLNASDRAVDLLESEKATRINAAFDAARSEVEHLAELMMEKFRGVALQFDERDVRVTQASTQDKTAIAAALQAAKEAVGEQAKSFTLSIDKAETNTAKQIDGLNRTLESVKAGFDAQLSDLKERQTRSESTNIGRVEQRASSNTSTILTIGGVGMILALLELGLRLAGR